MFDRRAIERALAELAPNAEQYAAATETRHCVVLAGPGSGKTKTLTTAMARALVEDVVDPRGVACITYNNECAVELEARLAALGISRNERAFIGTVHGFALAHVIMPYARCIPGLLPDEVRVASKVERESAVSVAYDLTFEDHEDPQERWAFAEEKRRRDVNRMLPTWRGRNPELATFIERYESELRHRGLIDFDDMPLIAFRMVSEHAWIRAALTARFPVLFVDEYQDLGHALHELVLLMCFEGGMRLFAVGDADQSIYGFTGANPELLQNLVERSDVRQIRLRFNYRSGKKIIGASLGALGEERDYRGPDDASDGQVTYWKVNGALDAQAKAIAENVVPTLAQRFSIEKMAVLYRAAWLGNKLANSLDSVKIPFVRNDGNALIKRNSRLARFIEGCAVWVTGGWRHADPAYAQLLQEAAVLAHGGGVNQSIEQAISNQLISFLRSSLDAVEDTHSWLLRFHHELIASWQSVATNPQQEWDICAELIAKTDPVHGRDMPLEIFAGRVEGSGRITLSTLHSAKGREFDAVILYGMNKGDIPSKRDEKSHAALREARRLFYVGATRPREELAIVYQAGNHSPWVEELYRRSTRG